jgi:hypothetical protein
VVNLQHLVKLEAKCHLNGSHSGMPSFNFYVAADASFHITVEGASEEDAVSEIHRFLKNYNSATVIENNLELVYLGDVSLISLEDPTSPSALKDVPSKKFKGNFISRIAPYLFGLLGFLCVYQILR